MKELDAKEFRDLGLLQEVNRRFFHPLGLAMFVNIDEETGKDTIGGIYDERHDPEGFFYGDIDIEKVKSVKAIEDSRREARIQKLGYWVEPVELSPDTAIIPPETIAKANADSAFIGGLTHERGTGYPITESDESKRIAEAVANTPHSC